MIQLAGCVIVNDQHELLLLHRNTEKITQWELPGGKVEPGEDGEVAAIREVKEELGVAVRLTGRLGEASFVEGDKEWIYVWYAAEITDDMAPRVMEQDMFNDLTYWPINALSSRDDLSPNMQNLVGSGILRSL